MLVMTTLSSSIVIKKLECPRPKAEGACPKGRLLGH